MRYQVLACDYDGTLAHHGRVDDATIAALERLLATGRRLLLVTGREMPELLQVFPRLDLFEWVVAENGALLYRPSTREERPLAPPPSEEFLLELQRRGVAPMSAGRVIVATWEPHENAVLDTIRAMGLELQVIFNKGAVMVLPAGVNKASGLAAALHEMSLSPHNAVAVGDAENDHAFLRACECAAAVANALPAVKDTADFVTPSDHGAGVTELIEQLVANDLGGLHGREARRLPLGTAFGSDTEVTLPPYGPFVLISGPSASGKSTVATALLEAVADRGYQFCVIDPEGDYETYKDCAALGGPQHVPSAAEAMRLLEKPEQSLVVSLTGMPIPERPLFFLELLPQLLKMRARLGRPHWLLLDEAHHLMPAAWQPPAGMLPEELHSTILLTVHPELLAPAVLGRVDTLLAVGQEAATTLRQFADATGAVAPEGDGLALEAGEALLSRRGEGPPVRVKIRPCRTERRRHRRKYAEGNLPPDRSFYFRGPRGKLNLRAQNLMLFLQMAEGVDDATWDYHLRQGDYARWFREGIKDEALAAEAERVAGLPKVKAAESRALIKAAVERDYTLPVSPLPVAGAS